MRKEPGRSTGAPFDEAIDYPLVNIGTITCEGVRS